MKFISALTLFLLTHEASAIHLTLNGDGANSTTAAVAEKVLPV